MTAGSPSALHGFVLPLAASPSFSLGPFEAAAVNKMFARVRRRSGAFGALNKDGAEKHLLMWLFDVKGSAEFIRSAARRAPPREPQPVPRRSEQQALTPRGRDTLCTSTRLHVGTAAHGGRAEAHAGVWGPSSGQSYVLHMPAGPTRPTKPQRSTQPWCRAAVGEVRDGSPAPLSSRHHCIPQLQEDAALYHPAGLTGTRINEFLISAASFSSLLESPARGGTHAAPQAASEAAPWQRGEGGCLWGYPGTRVCACTGTHVCARAEGWQRQTQGWKGVKPPSWVPGAALPHGAGGHRDPSPGKAGLRAPLIKAGRKNLLLITRHQQETLVGSASEGRGKGERPLLITAF